MSSKRRNSRREKRSVADAPIDQVARISGKRRRVWVALTEDKRERSKLTPTKLHPTSLLEIPRGEVGCKGEETSLSRESRHWGCTAPLTDGRDYPAEDFLRFFSGAAACACAETARTGGFLPPAVVGVFSAMLFLSASIKSMTGASFGCSAVAISWPWRLASIIFSMLSM